MHLKIVKAGGYEYVRLVEAYREDGVVKHRILFNLGRKDIIEGNPSFQRLAQRLAEISLAPATPSNHVGYPDCSEGILRHYGFIVYRKLWHLFRLDEMLKKLKAPSRLKFDLRSTCFLMVLQHLLSPRSKLATYERREQYLGIPSMELNHLYRTLDVLEKNKEYIENHIFERYRSLFNPNIDVVFYDVTTFHFESVSQDGLRDFGFSKANKINEVQVVMGLLIDSEGHPIGYELFSGNTAESKTLVESLDKLKKRFCIRQVIVVADRGLNCKLNLKHLKDRGYDYIVASSLKKWPESNLKEVFEPEGYETLARTSASSNHSPEKEDVFKYKIIQRVNRIKLEDNTFFVLPEQVVITYSANRAAKDRHDRDRLVEKAKKLLENPGTIKASNKRGGKKYIQQESKDEQYLLNEAAIARDQRFDGYYAIQSSRLDMDAVGILDAYHTLWKIEESFRVMKSTLEVRPVFHWTEERIKGHFVVCFLSFLLERSLESRLKETDLSISSLQIQEAINSLTFTEVEMQGQKYLIKMRPHETANKMMRVLKIAPPKNIMTINEANEFTWSGTV